jgi:hypothetical protein
MHARLHSARYACSQTWRGMNAARYCREPSAHGEQESMWRWCTMAASPHRSSAASLPDHSARPHGLPQCCICTVGRCGACYFKAAPAGGGSSSSSSSSLPLQKALCPPLTCSSQSSLLQLLPLTTEGPPARQRATAHCALGAALWLHRSTSGASASADVGPSCSCSARLYTCAGQQHRGQLAAPGLQHWPGAAAQHFVWRCTSTGWLERLGPASHVVVVVVVVVVAQLLGGGLHSSSITDMAASHATSSSLQGGTRCSSAAEPCRPEPGCHRPATHHSKRPGGVLRAGRQAQLCPVAAGAAEPAVMQLLR